MYFKNVWGYKWYEGKCDGEKVGLKREKGFNFFFCEFCKIYFYVYILLGFF